MNRKVERALRGPSWTEVMLGAALSLLLGIVLGAALLILRPAIAVREIPKQPVADAVYFIQGIPGGASDADQVLAKAKLMSPGETVKFSEEELNSVAVALTAPAAAEPGQKPAAPPADRTIATGTPNVRIHAGKLQLAVPITISALGFSEKIIAQARGGFVRRGGEFVYDPTEMYLGSCPLQRVPFLGAYLQHKLLASEKVPPEIAGAWSRLSNVSVEGNRLALTM